MRHPFELQIEDLEALDFKAEKQLAEEAAAKVAGGKGIELPKFPFPITQACYETGC